MSTTTTPPSTEGLAPFSYAPALKPLETYYKVFGDLTSGVRPLVLLHGGAGMSHDYLLSHTMLVERYEIPLVFYDQIGSGRSTHLPETAEIPGFWTETIFIAQLQQLLSFLGVEGDYALLGSSWGGMLGSKFAGQQPKGLKKLVLTNAPASNALGRANEEGWKKGLEVTARELITRKMSGEELSTEEESLYQQAMQEQVHAHSCNVSPLPEELLVSIGYFKGDMTVYNALGHDPTTGETIPGEFMDNWDTSEDAKNIVIPTLVLNGRNEIASGDAVKPFLEHIKDVRGVTFEGSTHSPHLEETEAYMKIVGEFLLS